MKDYVRVEIVRSGEVDKYLSEGWEIIETARFSNDYGPAVETRLDYHVGFPARVLVDNLLSILKDYEAHGLKEKLYEKVAESFGENASDYDFSAGHSISTNATRYMEKYERLVNNRYVYVKKKFTQEELDEQAEFNF